MASQTGTPGRKKAVALRYKTNEDTAPVVIAKGTGLIAERIIALAEENKIPLYQDPDLVELLSKIDLGYLIPAELYKAVAEVLAFIYRMNEKFDKGSG